MGCMRITKNALLNNDDGPSYAIPNNDGRAVTEGTRG